jgi:putative GTP pyrophosphokinase
MEIPVFQKWGEHINQKIFGALETRFNDFAGANLFLKIPPKPRVKDVNSIVSKAFYRKKNYGDPYVEITDKVGLRYVVLLKEDIETVREIVQDEKSWSYSLDKDFEDEKSKNPTTFVYQSVHYVVRNNEDIIVEETKIPANTPCEIQIRTLLQHAYSEMSHDTIYKPKTKTTPEVHRLMAKSMALIEVTDDMFGEADMSIKKHQVVSSNFLTNLNATYKRIIAPDYEEKLNVFILDAFKDLLGGIDIGDLQEYASEEVIRKIITRNYSRALIYRQPVILFIYYLIDRQRNVFRENWPLTDEELRPLFSDLGIAFDSAY